MKTKAMRGRDIFDEEFTPLTAIMNGGEYTVTITDHYLNAPIVVSTVERQFTIPYSRFTDYFKEEDAQPQDYIDRMQYFEKMTFDEFQTYFESTEEQAAPMVAFYICKSKARPWFRDGDPVIVHTIARTARCKNRYERLVAMFFDMFYDLGYELDDFITFGFNECVYDALRVYERAHGEKSESDKTRVVLSSGNHMAIDVLRYDLEYLIERSEAKRSWRRRNKLKALLEILNGEDNDNRNSMQ